MDENEPVDSGMRRFRRAVMASNLLMEVGGETSDWGMLRGLLRQLREGTVTQ